MRRRRRTRNIEDISIREGWHQTNAIAVSGAPVMRDPTAPFSQWNATLTDGVGGWGASSDFFPASNFDRFLNYPLSEYTDFFVSFTLPNGRQISERLRLSNIQGMPVEDFIHIITNKVAMVTEKFLAEIQEQYGNNSTPPQI